MKTELETLIEMFTRTGLRFQTEKRFYEEGTVVTGYRSDIHSMFIFDADGKLVEHRPYRAEDY